MQNPFPVQGGEGAVNGGKNVVFISLLAEYRFRNDRARNLGNAHAVVAVDFEAVVHKPRDVAIHYGRTRGQRGQQGQYGAYGCMKSAKLRIIGEGEIDMHALEIRPSMSPAVKNTVEGLIYLAVAMRPKTHFPIWVHPGMHRCGHKTGVPGAKQFIGMTHLGSEQIIKPGQRRHGFGYFEFNDMQHKFIGPRRGTFSPSKQASSSGTPAAASQLVRQGATSNGPGQQSYIPV